MSAELEPLPAELRALLDREADGYGEHGRRVERSLSAFELRLALREAAPADPVAVLPPRRRVPARRVAMIAAAALLAAVGAHALIANPERARVPAPAPSHPPVRRRAPKPVQAPSPAPEPAPAPAPALAPAPAPAPRNTLSAERTLIETARTALVRARYADALGALARHQQRFPQGQLAEEREALAIQALELLGQSTQAAERRARFREHFPDSLLR